MMRWNFQSLKKTIGGAKKDLLDMFFPVKMHKEGMPFRAIVIENDSWQDAFSGFLQKHLKLIRVNDLYLVPTLESILNYLSKYEYPQQLLYAFSIDVVYLFLFCPAKPTFFCALCESIDDFGPVASQNSIDNFMELLRFYLCSMAVAYNYTPVLQKAGICVGSCIAPLLGDLFLPFCDKHISTYPDTA